MLIPDCARPGCNVVRTGVERMKRTKAFRDHSVSESSPRLAWRDSLWAVRPQPEWTASAAFLVFLVFPLLIRCWTSKVLANCSNSDPKG